MPTDLVVRQQMSHGRMSRVGLEQVGDVNVPAPENVHGAALLARRPRAVGGTDERRTVDGKARGRLQVEHERQNAGVNHQRQEGHKHDETGTGQQTANAQLVAAQVALQPLAAVALATAASAR